MTAGDIGPFEPPAGVVATPVTAVCMLTFHLTEGQNVDACYPENALDQSELRAVAFHAFPDSMSVELHIHSSVRDSSFFFRIRRTAPAAGRPAFLYGHVFCRQRQDERLQRGGEQRSVVVLSPLPLGAALTALSRHAGPLCMARGAEALRQVYEEAAQWPSLEWGSTMALPLGIGSVRVELPELSTLPADAAAAAAALQGGESLAAALTDELDEATGLPLCLLPPQRPGQAVPPACGMFSGADVYTPLRPVLPHLWALWEIVLLGEPLMVAAPSPGACSAAAAALVSLLSPYPCGSDFRPYFTIHDPSFAAMAAAPRLDPATPPPPVLLGVTNPLFLKSLTHWPNVISTGYTSASQADSASTSSLEEADSGGGGGGGGTPRAAALHSALPSRQLAARLGSLLRRRPAGAQSLLSAPSDSAWLSYRPCIRVDGEVLAALVHAEAGDPPEKRRRLAQVNSATLRRHFEELARAVLAPLLPAITPTLPPVAPADAEELRTPPALPPFDPAAVLAGLTARGNATPEILFRRFPGRALAQFYARLLASPALRDWVAARRSAAELWQHQAWRAAWHAAGGASRLPGMSHTDEVALVERFFVLEERCKAGAGAEAASEQLRQAFRRLPADLQSSLLLSPERASLLQADEDAISREGAVRVTPLAPIAE